MRKKYMMIALKEAKKALNKGEVPVGCVIVKNNKIISKAHNLKEKYNSSIKHAEIIAIEKANKKLKNWRLIDCEMYITMFPCPMCASAIKQSRIKKIYCGIANYNNEISDLILNENDINKKIEYELNILKNECNDIIKEFFDNIRN